MKFNNIHKLIILMNKFSFFNYNKELNFKHFEAPIDKLIESPITTKVIEVPITTKVQINKCSEIEIIADNVPKIQNAIPIAKCINKKKKIPKHIKTLIWNKYIGDDIIKHKCLCCKKETIRNTDFEAGHILSEHNGGTNEIDNLRPICRPCNSSMGTMHMIEYIKMYGLYI